MNAVQSVLQIVYWFHPAVWVAGREIRNHREMAVDEAIASGRRDLSPNSYEQTILALSEHAGRRSVPAIVGLVEPRSLMFRRVVRLLSGSFTKTSRKVPILSWIMVGIFAVFFIPMGMSQPRSATAKTTESDSAKPSAEAKATSETTQKAEVNYLGERNFPRVIELDPPNGASDVDPSRKHITVTFDRPMRGGYSWVDKGKRPKLEKIEWINDRQCRASVTLEPNREYGVWLNFGPNTSKFRSREGVAADRVYWTFHTAASPEAAITPNNPSQTTDPPPNEQAKALLDKAEELHKAKNLTEAIAVYNEIYEKYPSWNYAAHALMMIGICYDNMNKKAEALEAFEKAAQAYPDLKGFSETTYFHLGEAYVQANQKEKALEAFKKSVQLCQGVREPNAFPCKQAAEQIAKLESETEKPEARATTTLQTLIDKAKPGDVIVVPPGKHAGPLRISQAITLRGDNAEKCIIELLADEPAITIRGAKDVHLENLTIRWSPKSTDARIEAPAAVYVRDSDPVLLLGCSLEPVDRPKETPYGLMAAGRSDVTFQSGSTSGFAYAIIFLEGANGAVINSVLTGAGHSVVTLHANSHVKIHSNLMARCDYHAVRNTGGTMEMTSNLVIANNRAGAYLGNSSAHGTIANNLFTQNRGEIWAYAESDVTIENNVFYSSNHAGIGFRDTCKLLIRRNSFVNNPQALAQYSKDGKPERSATRAENNYYWNNKQDLENFDGETSPLRGDPRFKDPENGDFSVQTGSLLMDAEGHVRAGLTDPKVINALWGTWSKSKRP
jgi:tetratricopeptide (TPR) repeat protein